jgi:Sulfotransferase family
MQDQIDKPIFVVGSPRSGTSVLTWCLGQHPNIVPLPESGWMGDFAIDLAIRYQIGTARGDDSVLSAMNIKTEEFFTMFGENINALILRHRIDLERKRWERSAGPNAPPEDFVSMQPTVNQKTRWVDGTPEYSFHICGLRKLFPKALFIHIVRDVTSVVRSMLNFHRLSGSSLVPNEQEAYNYWSRTVCSCLLAEQAYGPRVVFRLRYSDLVDTPEAALRPLFDFLNERFATECLTPLRSRINSSNVPADFQIGDPATDLTVVERATELWAELDKTPQPSEASPAAAEEIEAAFAKRVQYVATMENITALQARAERLAKEVKGKKAIIQHLRGRRQRYKTRRSFFRRGSGKLRNGWWNALREAFRRRTRKNVVPIFLIANYCFSDALYLLPFY